MPIRSVLLGFGLASALVHVVSYIMIMAALDRRGYKTNMLLARLYFGRYLKAYKEATVKETGKPGWPGRDGRGSPGEGGWAALRRLRWLGF